MKKTTLVRFALLASLVTAILVACSSAEEKPDEKPTQPAAAGDQTPAPEKVAAKGKTSEEKPPLGRLPTDVAPLEYDLHLTIVPEKEKFSGEVMIKTELKKARDVIWLHGQKLEMKKAAVIVDDKTTLPAKWEQVTEDGVAKLTLDKPVGPGRVTLQFVYDAPFDRQLRGLYKVEEGGESYAFTQFEAISARLCWPGFDEPAFKTPYNVMLTVKKEHQAIANTLVLREEIKEGMKTVSYAPTEKLPTYLLAFAVGPLDVVEAKKPIGKSKIRDREIPFRAVAAKGKGKKLAYALEHTPGILESLENYFGTAYPYDKLDIIAVPDFASGAMENAGAITFREWLLLLDEKSAPDDQKRGFSYVMAHELAHQWFGNLVTMPWWDDIWLNEAFATWMGHKAVIDVYPKYKAEIQLYERALGAMGTDSLVSARQIRQPIENNHDIRNAFDGITYSKGGGVLSMFERYVTEEKFRDGVRHYLEKYRFGNATYDQFLAAISEKTGKDITEPFKTFLFQPGVPFLDVRSSCMSGKTKLHVKQSRYFPVGSGGNPEAHWSVPVCTRFQVGKKVDEMCHLMTQPEEEWVLTEAGCTDWQLPNADGAGYYRISMPSEDVGKLMKANTKLNAKEKLALIDSLYAALNTGRLPAADVYTALVPFAKSRENAVAKAPMGPFAFAEERLLSEAKLKANLKKQARKLYAGTYRRLGFASKKKEDPDTRMLRQRVIGFLALTADDPKVRKEAARRGRKYLGGKKGGVNPKAVDPNLVGVALAVAVQEGDEKFFDGLVERFKKTDDALLRTNLLSALGRTRDPKLAEKVRALILDPALRGNEIFTLLGSHTSEEENREAAWQWMEKNFDALKNKLPISHQGYLPYFARIYCSAEKRDAVAAFFKGKVETLPGGPRNLKSALERVGLCEAKVNALKNSANRYFGGAKVNSDPKTKAAKPTAQKGG
jgi:alanyl aminopeptidase